MEWLKTLLDREGGDNLLTPELTEIYGGPLSFPEMSGRPYTIVNFVMTVEGITSFNIKGHMGGGDISCFNPQDTFVMGLLRAMSDGVAVGANTLRLEPEHLWTPEFISKEHAGLYNRLREKLGKKTKNPVNIFVTGSGNVLPGNGIPEVFTQPEIDTMILTTEGGKFNAEIEFSKRGLKSEILSFGSGREVDLPKAMQTLKKRGIETLLVEGGAGFNGSMMDAELVDELFLTRAPQVIGVSPEKPRPLFVSGFNRSPENAIHLKLISTKVSGSHIFERLKIS